MRAKTSHPILITIVVILSIALCATFAAIMFQNSTPPDVEDSSDVSIPVIPGDTKPYTFDYSWVETSPYIAHALGGILDSVYTNSYEAFLLNYNLGQRLFEADFNFTSDGDLVLLHGSGEWVNHIAFSQDIPMTTNIFLSALYDRKFHTLDYQTIIDLMISHPDIYLVTDSKYLDQTRIVQEFTQIVAYAESKDPSVLDRFVVQIYYPEMLDYVMEIYPWKSIIYTLYQNPNWTPENVLAFAQESGVEVITLQWSRITPEIAQLWNNAGLTIAAFTLNDLDVVDRIKKDYDVKLIYTDYLLP